MTAYAFNFLGDTYHTEPDCPAVSAFDTLTRITARKSGIPEGRSHCRHCQRLGGDEQ